jgi:ATP-dependent helicase Lhr and Lhr-like helicase
VLEPISEAPQSAPIHESSERNAFASAAPKVTGWLMAETGVSETAARQLADYFVAVYKALGVIPSQETLVLERFFDESGGMQLVIHSPFGIRINRAWGLALRKRFCRSFNFELQAAATDDAIVLSLGTQHSFPLEDVFRFLHSNTVRDILVQALLDAPMFGIHWRWNATRSLALPRQRGGRKIPAPLQRMESENLLAAVFPDQLACLENIAGDREVPDHPLVRQTIDDCLTEVMDIDGLVELLKKIEAGQIRCVARDLPEPSPLAHEILNARPYAFLDNAPLEERRTQAVYTRRASDQTSSNGLGILDAAAIATVSAEAWPRATNPDELHEALLLAAVMTDAEIGRTIEPPSSHNPEPPAANGSNGFPSPDPSCNFLQTLMDQRRVGRLASAPHFWMAAERLPMIRAIYTESTTEPALIPPQSAEARIWERGDAIRELVRGRMEVSGPLTGGDLSDVLRLPRSEIQTALLALEGEGFILRGRFRHGHAGNSNGSSATNGGVSTVPESELDIEWCDRRLLARIHRLTINRLRAEIQPVSIGEFQRFLLVWQRAVPEHQGEGPEGLDAVLQILDGYQLPAAAWEPHVLALRIKDYSPRWLDQLCFTGRIGWGRLSAQQNGARRPSTPIRSSPVSLFTRDHLHHWLALCPIAQTNPQLSSPQLLTEQFTPDTTRVWNALAGAGALFFGEIVKKTGLLPSKVEEGLAELAAQGWATSDSFEGLRALLLPRDKRTPFVGTGRKRHHKSVTSVEFAGRWSVLRQREVFRVQCSVFSNSQTDPHPGSSIQNPSSRSLIPELTNSQPDHHSLTHKLSNSQIDLEVFARALLHRYGLVFRRLLEREAFTVSWYELGRVYRRLEARGEIRGGHFVSGVSGEQFALPEAIAQLRSVRKQPAKGELIAISGADPLNLVGILSPGPRISAISSNRILLRDGVPVAALESGIVVNLASPGAPLDAATERALRIGTLPPELRRYYAR